MREAPFGTSGDGSCLALMTQGKNRPHLYTSCRVHLCITL